MFKNGCFTLKGGVVFKLLWLLVLKICFEKLATMISRSLEFYKLNQVMKLLYSFETYSAVWCL